MHQLRESQPLDAVAALLARPVVVQAQRLDRLVAYERHRGTQCIAMPQEPPAARLSADEHRLAHGIGIGGAEGVAALWELLERP